MYKSELVGGPRETAPFWDYPGTQVPLSFALPFPEGCPHLQDQSWLMVPGSVCSAHGKGVEEVGASPLLTVLCRSGLRDSLPAGEPVPAKPQRLPL